MISLSWSLLLPLLLAPQGAPRAAPSDAPSDAAAPVDSAQEAIRERLDGLFRHCADHGLLNGAVLVKDGGRVVYRNAFGVADPRTGRALEVDSAFYLASVSKQFTSMAAMILAEDELLALDDRLADYLPEFAEFAGEVRIHHLMTHTSGIPDHYELLQGVPAGLTNERVRALLAEHGRLEFEPGSRFRYSNGGYVLLSMVVAEAGGKSFREVLAERVLEPLGMANTAVFDESEPAVRNRAHGFRTGGTLDDYELFTTGAGGMYSTVDDLALWDAALHDGDLVSAEMQQRAYTPPSLPNGERTNYGFGWQLFEHGGRRLASHGGGMVGFSTYIVRDLGSRDTFVLLSNQADSVAGEEMTQCVAAILSGRLPQMPRIPIGPLLRQIVAEDGLEAALERYAELWDSDERAGYDLGEDQLNAAGYAYLRAGELDVALALFERNTVSYPRSFNTWDSLAEAQAAMGQVAEAVANYERSLELNPDNANAVRALARLRGE